MQVGQLIKANYQVVAVDQDGVPSVLKNTDKNTTIDRNSFGCSFIGGGAQTYFQMGSDQSVHYYADGQLGVEDRFTVTFTVGAVDGTGKPTSMTNNQDSHQFNFPTDATLDSDGVTVHVKQSTTAVVD